MGVNMPRDGVIVSGRKIIFESGLFKMNSSKEPIRVTESDSPSLRSSNITRKFKTKIKPSIVIVSYYH